MKNRVIDITRFKSLLFACFTLFALNSFAKLPGQWKNITIVSNSMNRDFKVYIPSQIGQIDVKRVVYMFHGTSQNADKMIEATGWADKAEQEKFLAIFPNSLSYELLDVDSTVMTSRWNDGTLELKQNAVPADDVQFFKDMQLWLTQNYGAINKTFLSGFSNGAVFALRLLQEVPEQITAAGVVSSKVPFPKANPTIVSVPTMIIYGTMDARVRREIEENDGVAPMTYPEFIASSLLQDIVEFNTSRNQLTTVPTSEGKLSSPVGYQWIYEWPIQPIPFSRNHFEIRLYNGLTHRYPQNNGIPNQLNATLIFWDFFIHY